MKTKIIESIEKFNLGQKKDTIVKTYNGIGLFKITTWSEQDYMETPLYLEAVKSEH